MRKDNIYFITPISIEQIDYTKKLVDYSFENHVIPNIFDFDKDHHNKQYKFRFIGTLGEVVFADTYHCNRPKKSFGATDGQDFGSDFTIHCNGLPYSIDVKTMYRKSKLFKPHFSMNLSKYQVEKPNSKTDFYSLVNISKNNNRLYASFFGMVNKSDVLNGKVGKLCEAGQEMKRSDNTKFNYVISNYDVKLSELIPPIVPLGLNEIEGVEIHNFT